MVKLVQVGLHPANLHRCLVNDILDRASLVHVAAAAGLGDLSGLVCV